MTANQYIHQKYKSKIDGYMRKRAGHFYLDDLTALSYCFDGVETPEIANQNDFYGNAYTLKRYAGLEDGAVLNATIEHAAYLGQDFCWSEDIQYLTRNIICVSDFRKSVLEANTDKKPIVVGPYIAYASSYYSKKKVCEIKNEIGKVLLVFPTHSTMQVDSNFDVTEFINEIESVKKHFDTVVVCIYWKDISRGLWKPYREKGYWVVSAGNIFDKFFLRRLKCIIEFSDATMTNGIGTNISYSMYLGKPCYVYKQKVESINHGGDLSFRTKLNDIYYELLKVFEEKDFKITEEQKKLCDYVYGHNKVKTRSEMKELLSTILKE